MGMRHLCKSVTNANKPLMEAIIIPALTRLEVSVLEVFCYKLF
ncbi:hypothetical protein Lepto7375DRAFT_1117 [Leptolyngbya sp. PCC 7375]|nr:hypothetical protein Lepto7375DRAFT_1117 [Leptolyngbya sp. PCC 7375]